MYVGNCTFLCLGGGEVFTVSPATQHLETSQSDAVTKNADGSTNEKHDLANHYFSQPAYLTVSGQLHLEAITTLVC